MRIKPDKKLFLCLFVGIALSFSSGMKAQTNDKKFTVHLENSSVNELIKVVERQSDYTFAYDEKTVDLKTKITVNADSKPIQLVLDEAFKGTELTYNISRKKILLMPAPKREVSQNQRNISGQVIDAANEPIIGAGVMVKGSKIGTITDALGNYTLSGVPDRAVIVISALGYQPKELSMNIDALKKVVLEEDNQLLDEVVVVGYGSQRKRDVTTSIASVKASEIADVPATSIEQALVGRLAGVQITQSNGTPGAGFDIKVRGVGTITAGSSPLYVIDGVPLSDDAGDATGISVSPLATIETSEIESIEILKDASAAAIYGSRGSNGVVIVTTKQGAEGKPKVSYNGYVGAQMATKHIDVLDAYEYAQLVFDGHNNSYRDQLISVGKADLYNPMASNQERWDNLKTGSINENQAWMLPPEIMPYINGEKGLTNTNWQDAVLRPGFITKHNLSLSGGNKNIKYLVAGNYQNEDGIVINSGFEKMGVRAKVDVNFKKFRFGGNINVTRNVYNLVNSEGRYADDGVLSLALGAAPIYPIYDENGNYNYQHFNTSYGQSKLNNPVAVANLIEDKMVRLQMLSIAYVEYEFIKGLKFRSQGSWNYNNYVRDYYRPAALPTSTNRTPPSNPTAESRTKNKYTWVWENTLGYKTKIAGKHNIDAIAGWTAQKFQGNSNRITATDLPMNDLLHTIPNNATATKYDSGRNAWTLLSALARAQYNYADRYLVSAAFRADGSSRFGKNNRWGIFPSVSGAWYISGEDFMKPTSSWLSNLKLRASWGVTGNMSIGDYASYGIVDGDNYVFNGVESLGAKESTFGNPNLGWEKTSQVNLGLDIGLFYWLTFEMDLYRGVTTDMLLDVPVLEASGFSSILQNIGSVENKGLEMTLSTNNKIGDLHWTNSVNFSMNRNKVLSLGGADQMISQAEKVIDFITQVGQPIGNYYTYVVDGVYSSQAEIETDVMNGIIVPNAKPGDFRFKKFGSDDTINADDRQITGNYLPDFTYGYSTSLKYKGIDFSLALQGVYGNEIANINRRYLANMEGNANQLAIAKDRWVSPSQPGSGSVYRANRSATGMNSVISTWHIEDGSYMRIREITLGYSLPNTLTKKMGISGLRFYVSAFNPFTFTNYSGYNPEVSTESSPIMQGVDYGTYPLAKSFVFGINFNL